MALDRLGDWERFHRQVKRHIVSYTIPQYENEDAQQDQVGAWTAGDCIRAIQRYVTRSGKGQRGPKEELRDLLKIAHYAQLAYEKLKDELGGQPDVYTVSFAEQDGGNAMENDRETKTSGRRGDE